jgi:hypothetical protein
MTPPIAPCEYHSVRVKSRASIAGVIALVSVLSGCGGGPSPKHALTGHITVPSLYLALADVDAESSDHPLPLSKGDPCPSDSDLPANLQRLVVLADKINLAIPQPSENKQGKEVIVKNEKGTIVATGELKASVVGSSGSGLDSCVYPFSIAGVPKASIYTVSVANEGDKHYSFADLESKKWNLELTLG